MELIKFFEGLEGDDLGDVSSFENPDESLLEESYADFQQITGLTIPFSEFKSWSPARYQSMYSAADMPPKVGAEYELTDSSDPLRSLLHHCILRIILDTGMNATTNPSWMYQHHGEAVSAEVEIYLKYPLIDKKIPLAKYKRLPGKGIKRTWINSSIKRR